MGYLTNNYTLLPVSSQFVPQIPTLTVPRGAQCCKEDVLRYVVAVEHQKWALCGSGPTSHLYTLICASTRTYPGALAAGTGCL